MEITNIEIYKSDKIEVCFIDEEIRIKKHHANVFQSETVLELTEQEIQK